MGTRFRGELHGFDCDGCGATLDVSAKNDLDAFAELRTFEWTSWPERKLGDVRVPATILCKWCGARKTT